MTGCRPKYYSIVKDEDGSVAELESSRSEQIVTLLSGKEHTRVPCLSGTTRPLCRSNMERTLISGSDLYFSTINLTANLPSSE